MSTSRRWLHKSALEEFKQFCQSRGWTDEPFKSTYEVLRMRHPKLKHPLIVWERNNAKEHLTTFGNSFTLAGQFIVEKRKAAQHKEPA